MPLSTRTDGHDSQRLAWALVLLLTAVSLASFARITPGMYSDPGWGVLAAEQMRLGKSSGLRTFVSADPTDLRRDIATTASWWPPSYQAIPFAFRWLGCDWGAALKATELLAWFAALVGWGLVFRKLVSAAQLPWLLLCFIPFRYLHAAFHLYDGEVLAVAAFPWVLLLNVRALDLPRPPLVLAALAGAATVGLFIVKYSALLSGAALCAVWAWLWLRRRLPLASVLAYLGAAASCFLLMRAFGIPGGPTPASVQGAFEPARLLTPIAWLSLAFTDLDALFEFMLGHPSRDVLTPWLKTAIGLVLLVPLVQLARRNRDDLADRWRRSPALLACAIGLLVVVPLLLTVLVVTGAPIDESARHVRIPALAALPVVFTLLVSELQRSETRVRARAALLFGGFFALPALYGSATLVDKAFRRAPSERAVIAHTGVRVDLLGAGARAPRFYEQLRLAVPEPDAVFFWTSPDLALEFADRRMLVVHADFTMASELAGRRYRECPRGGVVLILPEAFETNGKERIIQRSFNQVSAWRLLTLSAAPALRLWLGDCAQQRALAGAAGSSP